MAGLGGSTTSIFSLGAPNRVLGVSAALAALLMASACAQSSARPGLPGLPQQSQAVINDNIAASQGKNIWERSNLFGDLRGLRAELAAQGIYVRLAEVKECSPAARPSACRTGYSPSGRPNTNSTSGQRPAV